MTRFTPKFFSSVTGVLQKQLAHSRLFEIIVHRGVTGLADFRACILCIGVFGFFGRLSRAVREGFVRLYSRCF
jgi:hypothetical protein